MCLGLGFCSWVYWFFHIFLSLSGYFSTQWSWAAILRKMCLQRCRYKSRIFLLVLINHLPLQWPGRNNACLKKTTCFLTIDFYFLNFIYQNYNLICNNSTLHFVSEWLVHSSHIYAIPAAVVSLIYFFFPLQFFPRRTGKMKITGQVD